MERGELVYSEGIGVADRAQNRAVDRQTRFNIGSVSEMFAAVAILLLVDDGKFEFDALFRWGDLRQHAHRFEKMWNPAFGFFYIGSADGEAATIGALA